MLCLETTIDSLLSTISELSPKSYFLEIVQFLATKFMMFSHLSSERIIEIANNVKIKQYKQKKMIIAQNQSVSNVYLIVRGTVKVSQDDRQLRVIEEGNSFGELFVLKEENSSFNIIAKSPVVVCLTLSSDYFIELLHDQKINDYTRSKMCIEEAAISLNDLYYLSYLGRGRFGNVCLVHNEFSFYAIKAISKPFVEKQMNGTKCVLSEKKVLCSLDHPFIVKMVKTLQNENWCFFLQEYISGKNMTEYFETKHVKRNIQETKFFSASLFTTISYIHFKKIIHRDIKPANIMIEKTGYIKLIDFGAAIKTKERTKTVIGTPNFIAPEVLNGKGYSNPCDYWSVGICIYFIFYGLLPFGNSSLEILDTYKEILEKEISFPDNSNINLNSLLRSLLNKNDQLRYSDLKTIKSHLFFKDFNWDDLINYKIKPMYIPEKDSRANVENLQNTNSPFVSFMESEKFDTKQIVTMKFSSKNIANKKSSNSLPVSCWEDF